MKYICISVDVEDDVTGSSTSGTIGIEQGLPTLLEVLNQIGARADFFFQMQTALKFPGLVRELKAAGHGIGNHGFDHRLFCAKPLDRQRKEVRRSTDALTSVTGTRPVMYRAANFSVDKSSLRVLQDAGYALDSSVLPGRVLRQNHVRKVYSHRGAPASPFFPVELPTSTTVTSLLEVPVTANPLRPGAPVGAGAVRLYGPKRMSEAVRAMAQTVITFLVHPWELVSLREFYPDLQDAYAKIASSDITPIREFLREAAGYAEFRTLMEVDHSIRGATNRG